MAAPELAKRAGVGLLVFAIVVAGGIAVAGGSPDPAATAPSMNYSAYGPDTVAAVPAASGSVQLSTNHTDAVVLIDAGHGNAVDRDQLSPLVSAVTERGGEVRFLTGAGSRGGADGSAFNQSLRGADAFVSISPDRQYTDGQLAALEAFADAGGRILIAKDPASMSPVTIIFGPPRGGGSAPMPLAPLAGQFGMSFGNGYLYNMHEYDTNYRNVYGQLSGSGPLTAGVDRLVLHESTPVRGPEVLVRTGSETELSTTRSADSYGVVARSGNVVALGDASVLGSAYHRRADNEVLVGNLLDFLVTADKQPENAPVPPEPTDEETERPPRPP